MNEQADDSMLNRRQVLGLSMALGWPALAIGAPYGSSPAKGAPLRFAVLVGNRAYPTPFDLPPVHKNIRDVKAVLEQRGFDVTVVVDQDSNVLRKAMTDFARKVQAAPPDAIVLFYFTGHGMQVDAENLLLGAGVNPSGKEDALLGNGLMLKRDLLDALPHRPTGLSMVVIDACRTSLRANDGGLNQVEAPLGCLVAFATGAGKPAIAPAVETLNTFYTASLVKILQGASDDLTFSDMFRLVKLDVQQTMLNHPVSAIRAVAQFPFIAENTQVRTRLALKSPSAGSDEVQFNNADEKSLWQRIEDCYWPADAVKYAEEYLQRFPNGKLAGAAQVAREGATDAAKAMQRNDVRLFKSAFSPKPESPQSLLRDLHKAALGDKDAAARIARMYRKGADGLTADNNRYEGWMQFAAALGNGIASYELALYYRGQDQPLLAAQFESRARELGYTPPPTLDHYRK